MQPDDRHALLTALFQTAIAAVHSRHLIPQTVTIEKSRLVVQRRDGALTFALPGRLFLIGAGKGAGSMAQAPLPVLGQRKIGGCVIIPSEQAVSELSLPGVRVMQGEHPLPGPGSASATRALVDSLSPVQPHDLVLICLTGGASSLLVWPAAGLTLADKTATNAVLLACGADILALNTVRKHLSQIKGGWLAHHAQPATVVSLILSDVIGDDLSVVGSGPTVADPTTFMDAWRVVEQYGLGPRLPQSVLAHLEQGVRGVRPETPKPGAPFFSRVHNVLIGSNHLALQAVGEAAARRGLRSHLMASAPCW